MQIHQISAAKRKERKTVGRGGKRGTYSGRGNKGQKARSGGSVDPLFEGGRSSLVERLKKVRGFKSMHPKKVTVKLSALEKSYADGETVSLETLVAKGVVNKKDASRGAKIVATGALSKKLTVVGVLVSGAASEAIKGAGGNVE